MGQRRCGCCSEFYLRTVVQVGQEMGYLGESKAKGLFFALINGFFDVKAEVVTRDECFKERTMCFVNR